MDSKETTKSKIIDELIEWIETLLFSFLTIILLFTFVLRTSEVNGPSMYPTFVGRDDSIGQSGDMLIYLSCLTEFDNGDVVVVNSVAFDEPIIKRVIAKPGQTVTVDYENKLDIKVKFLFFTIYPTKPKKQKKPGMFSQAMAGGMQPPIQ